MAGLRIGCILILYFIYFAGASDNASRCGWVSEPDGRGTMSLLWGCLSTLFICLWASMHLNVPAEDDSALARFGRKLKWTCISAIAPELVSAMAFAQWWTSHRDTKLLRKEGLEQWTQVHSFYANMGGIHLKVDNCTVGYGFQKCPPKVIVNAQNIYNLFNYGLFPADALSANAIADKSKADSFVKAVACMQATWLVVQCIGRAAQHLPITTLELSTLAYILYALTNYALWWRMPLDVGTHTVIYINDTMAYGRQYSLTRYHQRSLLGGSIPRGVGDKRIPNDCSNGFDVRYAQFPMIVCCIMFGAIHCIAPTMYFFDWLRHICQNPDYYPRIPARFKALARASLWCLLSCTAILSVVIVDLVLRVLFMMPVLLSDLPSFPVVSVLLVAPRKKKPGLPHALRAPPKGIMRALLDVQFAWHPSPHRLIDEPWFESINFS